jgi:prevent-host-death family protein
MTTLTSREVNQDFGRAKKAATAGPVIITDRGRPAHVLLNIEAYRSLNNSSESVAEGLASDDTIDDFDQYIPARSVAPRPLIFD